MPKRLEMLTYGLGRSSKHTFSHISKLEFSSFFEGSQLIATLLYFYDANEAFVLTKYEL